MPSRSYRPNRRLVPPLSQWTQFGGSGGAIPSHEIQIHIGGPGGHHPHYSLSPHPRVPHAWNLYVRPALQGPRAWIDSEGGESGLPIFIRTQRGALQAAEKNAQMRLVHLGRSRQRAMGRRYPGHRHRIEGRGIDDDAGPRGTGPKRSLTFGVMPPRKEFRKHFDYYVGAGDRYRISNDRSVGTTSYSEPELFSLVKRFGAALGSSRKGSEEKASLASGIMETLGFEWI